MMERIIIIVSLTVCSVNKTKWEKNIAVGNSVHVLKGGGCVNTQVKDL